jgi:enamine deaminase RidA (YjgF/YER057c/UK114 family)
MVSSMYLGDLPNVTPDMTRQTDQAFETMAEVRTAILKNMTPKDIADMIIVHFDVSDDPQGYVAVLEELAKVLKETSPSDFYGALDTLYKTPSNR